MTDKEKLDAIRAEIHRLVDVRGYDRGMANDLFAFMDSLPNESVSNDLEDEAEMFASSYSVDEINEAPYAAVKQAFEFGAQWQKEQIMGATIKGIARPLDDEVWCDGDEFPQNIQDGDKVKLIIFKEG